jgi:excisionase family DNA binding protein
VKRKRTTVISLETTEVLAIRSQRRRVQAWCSDCAKSVSMVTADEAASVTGVDMRTIYRRVEEGKIHFTETPEGSLLICLNSFS